MESRKSALERDSLGYIEITAHPQPLPGEGRWEGEGKELSSLIKKMNTRTINPVQLHLLELFNYCRSEQTVSEMKDVLADFYARKVQAEADRLWDEGTLDGEAIERILHEHWRTSRVPCIK